MRLAALMFWIARRAYLRAVVKRIPPRHPESWITVSEIGECDARIARLHRRLSS